MRKNVENLVHTEILQKLQNLDLINNAPLL